MEGAGIAVLPTKNINGGIHSTFSMAEAGTAPAASVEPLTAANYDSHMFLSQQFIPTTSQGLGRNWSINSHLRNDLCIT